MKNFERIPPGESADIQAIVRGILALQARYATDQKRPLGRGTHAKGICASAQFTVFDLHKTVPDERLASRLAHTVARDAAADRVERA